MAKKKLTFEEALIKLENVVVEMDSNEISIDKSISLYREGIELAIFCGESLKNYEDSVKILKETSDNMFVLEKFEA